MSEPPGLPPMDAPAVGLTATYGRVLREMGKDDTPEGMLVLQLAHDLEFTGAADSLSARAAMARALQAAWRDVTSQPAAKGDALDEIAEARRKRFGG